jgi:hypothetical protein
VDGVQVKTEYGIVEGAREAELAVFRGTNPQLRLKHHHSIHASNPPLLRPQRDRSAQSRAFTSTCYARTANVGSCRGSPANERGWSGMTRSS